jgi:hypothetical protein
VRKALALFLFGGVLSLVLLAGCQAPDTSGDGGSSGRDIIGTWQWTTGYTETVSINDTTVAMTDTGSQTGSMTCAIQSMDRSARRFRMTVTASSGSFSANAAGTTIYVHYLISGNTLALGSSTSSYPGTTPHGPYYVLDFVGTWNMTGTFAETLVLDPTTFYVADTGTLPGTLTCAILALDPAANHIQVQVTTTTGNFSTTSYPVGKVLYALYSVIGDSLYLAVAPNDYPVTTTLGPYAKQ